MKKIFILLFCCLCLTSKAQQCNVQGIIQYYYNDYIGYKPDIGAEVMFIKYSSTHKIPNRSKWEKYQNLVDKWIKFRYLRKHFNFNDALNKVGLNECDKDTIQNLGVELANEKNNIIEKNLVKYTTIVDATGKYSITIPYGTYYILIKSRNRKFPTVLEYENRYHMERVKLNSPTQIVSFDFDILRNTCELF